MELIELEKVLKNKNSIFNNSFLIAKSLVNAYNNADDDSLSFVQTLIIRALDCYEHFGSSKEIIDSLIRAVGLFPYLKEHELNLKDFIAREAHKIDIGRKQVYFHAPQAEVYYKIKSGKSVVLSAPTSFGKSLIIDALIKNGDFGNIVIVVPTIALIDETRRRLVKFKGKYKILTHSLQSRAENNIYILTQERVLEEGFIDKVDFFIIDEFYKLSLWAEDKNRCALLNEVFYKLYKMCKHFYMLGPNIQDITGDFPGKVSYEFVQYNYNTVVTEYHDLTLEEKSSVLLDLCSSIDGQTIIFCSSPASANSVAKQISSHIDSEEHNKLIALSEWLSKEYHSDWVLTNAIRCGVGVHHARIPRSISQYIVHLFNLKLLKFLICTSTLIEGVNTTTKNIIYYDNKIDKKKIEFFTFNNISGRSGRMLEHFIGHVYLLSPPPIEKYSFVDIPAYTQGDDTPESLLINIDEEDLSPLSKERIKNITQQEYLSLDVIRKNKGIDPYLQISFARLFIENYSHWADSLLWRGYPTYEQLSFICEIIWDYFNGSSLGNRSVVSASQLAYKINQLRNKKSINDDVNLALSYKSSKNIDDTISDILNFRRLWANFHFPRLIRAIGNIVNDVQYNMNRTVFCDFSAYSIKVENYFYDPALVAMEEYGLPLEISKKFKIGNIEGDLDTVIDYFSNLNNFGGFTRIETDFLRRVKGSI
ncbi:DEAD/DEAH box helicase [Photorhabdus akhurstii]|uniref:DEAD/DEAH box helicase n=1 Tax=Photorhabdus akhurstii TaxID=171438 RepID=UPI000D4438FC|nr:helicase [Photorhabdus luminescens]